MATIRFYGDLKRFGRSFTVEVKSAAEGLRALFVQIPGLRKHINLGQYRLRVQKEDISPSELSASLNQPITSASVIHVVPVVTGAKSEWVSIIAGAAMIAAAFYTGGASMAAWGMGSTAMFTAGVAMMSSGIAMALTEIPQMDVSGSDGSDNSAFNNLSNTSAQGGCVPLVYGRVLIGSKVVSQGLHTE